MSTEVRVCDHPMWDKRDVVCCWGVFWSFGSLIPPDSSSGHNTGDVNGRDRGWPFSDFLGRWVLAHACGVFVVLSDLAYVATALRCNV